uniref:DUF7787 domain-containing protein n=1 Tax=Oryza meridionalis TaxID=40149 RepID=A0A0E0CZK2_9ORYZ
MATCRQGKAKAALSSPLPARQHAASPGQARSRVCKMYPILLFCTKACRWAPPPTNNQSFCSPASPSRFPCAALSRAEVAERNKRLLEVKAELRRKRRGEERNRGGRKNLPTMAPRGRGREMQGGPLTLERYHRFFVDPWGTRLTIDHLNHIISMHGFVKLQRSNKGNIMRRLVGQVDLQPPRRSTLHRAAAGPSSDAVIAADVVSADVDAIGWTECPIGSVAVLAASPGDAPEPVEPDPRPADFVLAGRRARSKRSRSSAYGHRPPDDGGGEGRWGVVAATAVDSAAVDAFSNSTSAASLATTRDAAAASSASATMRDGGTAASSSPTVLRPAHVGAASSSSSSPTVLRPADVGAASSPTPTLRRVACGGAMAVVGLAVAGGASPAGTATFLEPTDGAAVLPGTILGRAVLGCSTSAAAAVAAAALGPHQIAASSSAASATSSHLAAAAAAAAIAAAAAGSFLGQAGVLVSALLSLSS